MPKRDQYGITPEEIQREALPVFRQPPGAVRGEAGDDPGRRWIDHGAHPPPQGANRERLGFIKGSGLPGFVEDREGFGLFSCPRPAGSSAHPRSTGCAARNPVKKILGAGRPASRVSCPPPRRRHLGLLGVERVAVDLEARTSPCPGCPVHRAFPAISAACRYGSNGRPRRCARLAGPCSFRLANP